MSPTAIIICLIAVGVFALVGIICAGCELWRSATCFTICAAIAGISVLVGLLIIPFMN